MMEIRIVDLLLTILNFFILMGLLYLVLYRPVLNLLSAREAKIKRENEELARLRKEAEELRSKGGGFPDLSPRPAGSSKGKEPGLGRALEGNGRDYHPDLFKSRRGGV